MNRFDTRGAWLSEAIIELRMSLFKPLGHTVPELRVSVGFPGGRGPKHKAIGQYWPGTTSLDKMPSVFISPVVGDPVRALDVLVHELVHACTPGAGHKGAFKQLAKACGLTGKMTATVANDVLKERLNDLSQKLGVYPHSEIVLGEAPGKKQSTRMVKCECASCGYVSRTTEKWLETLGTPLCPCNGMPMDRSEK